MIELPTADEPDTIELPPADPIDDNESKLKRFGKQTLAGFLSTPAAIPGLYSLINSGTEKLGVDLPGGKAAGEVAARMQNWANETANTGPVENTSDAIANTLGSILLPIPAGPVVGGIKAIPGLAKLITAAPKTMKALGTAAEVITPGVVGPTAGKYVANVAVGTGLHEGVNALTGDPTYTSQLPDVGQDRTTIDLPTADAPGAPVLPPADPRDDNWSAVKIGAGLAALAVPAWYMLRRKPGQMLRSETIAGPSEDAARFQTATTPFESLQTQTQDAGAVLRSQVGRAAGPDTEKEFSKTIDLMTRSGGGAQIESIMKSGIYPGGKIRGPSMLSNQLEFQQLDPALQKTISDGMVGQDLVESRALHKGVATDLPGIDDATAKQMADALQTDPHANLFAIKLRQTMRDALTYAKDEGRLDVDTYQKLLKNRPNYVPMRRAGDDLTESQFDALMKRTDIAGEGAQEVLNPIQSAESYVAELTRRTMVNSVRRDFIDQLATGSDQALQNSMKQVKEYTPESIAIYRNGNAEYYEFADPLVKEALKLNPVMANGVAASMRSLYQQNTTGVLAPLKSVRSMIWDALAATNYREAGRSFGLLDQAVQSISDGKVALRGDIIGAVPSTVMGLGRTAGARIAASIAESIDADLRSGTGMWNNLPKPMATMVATRMRDAYLNSVYHAFEQGGRNAALLNDDMLQASQMLKGATDRLKNSNLGRMLGDVGAARLWRFYVQSLDTIQNAVKVQYVAENTGRASVDTLVHEARSIGGGDMSLRGLGSVRGAESTVPGVDKLLGVVGTRTKLGTDWLPYANATIQGVAKLTQVANRDRMNFAVGLGGSIGSIAVASAILNSTMSPEQREAYWSMPSWWRMSHISLPVGDTFEDRIEIPVPPEFTPFVAMVQNGVDQLLGLSNGQAAGLGPDMWQAIVDTVGMPMPPAFTAGLAAMGGRVGSGFDIQKIQESRVVPGYQHAGSVLPANIQETLASIFGSSANMLAETANAFATSPGDQGTSRAVSQLVGDTERNVPVFGVLWAGSRDYSSNEVSAQLSKKMQALDNITNQARNAMPRGGVQPVPATSNPLFNSNAMKIQFYLTKNPQIVSLKQNIKSTQNQIEGLAAVYPKTPDLLGQVSGAKRELRNMRDKMARQISDMESSVGVSLEDLDPSR